MSRAAARPRQAQSTFKVLDHIEPKSVFAVSAIFYAALLIGLLVAGVILWQIGSVFGVISRFDSLVTALGFGTFVMHGLPLFMAVLGIGLVLAILGALCNFFMAVVYNVIVSMVGGVRISLGK